MIENHYIPEERQNPPNCKECGHQLHDAWEGEKHRQGRHHYRTWTREEAAKQEDSGSRWARL